jgi:hypothetical protein
VSRTQLASIIVANILFLFGAVMDIFQLTSVTGNYSKYFQIRTAAAFYPFSGNQNIAQKQIVVVTIDEDFLQQEDERWPMPLKTHGKLLETLFHFKPQAIFYDIEFDRTLRRGEDPNEILDLAEQLARRDPSTVMYLAGTHLETVGGGDARPVFPGFRVPPELFPDPSLPMSPSDGIVPVDWNTMANMDPLLLDGGGPAGEDPDEDAGENSGEDHKKIYPTPGMALYIVHCAAQPASCRWDASSGGGLSTHALLDAEPGCQLAGNYPETRCAPFRRAVAARFSDTLSIMWGRSVAPEMTAVIEEESLKRRCVLVDPSALERLKESWRMIAGTVISKPDFVKNLIGPIDRGLCLYNITLPASLLAGREQLSEVALARLLQGKLVLVGTSHDTSSDLIQSPSQGTIPGVYSHAMVLDNLITFGPDYIRKRDFPAFQEIEISQTKVFELAIALTLLAITSMLADHIRLLGRSRLPNTGKASLDTLETGRLLTRSMLGAYAFVTLGAIFTLIFWRIDPINWAGLTLAAGIFSTQANVVPILTYIFTWIWRNITLVATLAIIASVAAIYRPSPELWWLALVPSVLRILSFILRVDAAMWSTLLTTAPAGMTAWMKRHQTLPAMILMIAILIKDPAHVSQTWLFWIVALVLVAWFSWDWVWDYAKSKLAGPTIGYHAAQAKEPGLPNPEGRSTPS